MTTQWLLNWWNLIFVVPFLVAVLYLAVSVVSGLGFGDGDVDGDADVETDADADVDTEVEVEADGDIEADADTDGDADADTDHEGVPLYMTALSWLGLGRVPLTLMLMAMLLGWGLVGFAANRLLWEDMQQRGAAEQLPMISIPVAAVGSLLLTALFAQLMGRWLPLNESYVSRRHELLGLVGEAVLPINREFGMAFVRDERGDGFQVPCRLSKDAQPIDKGAKVRLVGYNGKQKLFYVQPSDSAAGQQV